MAKPKPSTFFTFDKEKHCYQCEGSWSVLKLNDLLSRIDLSTLPEDKTIKVSGKPLTKFDSSGALALMHCIDKLKEKGKEAELIDFSKQQLAMLKIIEEKRESLRYEEPKGDERNVFDRIGEETIHKLHQADGFVILLGDLSTKFIEALGHWRRFQLPSIVSNVNSAGLQALPIVALLSFLIGVVLAYQMGLQLQTYGANIFIAYLSGMAIFREFAPLITAIIVAGRTSSAFTAQLGSMKINEEIDALSTMGLSPTELLVMPKVIGLLFVFPLLIFWADAFSIFGATIMSKWMLNVGYIDFMARLKESVGLNQMMLGLYKAPAFAMIIALVGCFQGFRVEANGASIGSQTTKSVVQALFLIIVADAVFSIIYSWMGI
ncbi:putative phospholipid ABC transporter permease protein MlaE [Legionella massiliensis]|uniref:Putative phospholipid ABC transporter permease protein MlaE n=1 Tax=Legionella massiliensis TaxID=1034943 RepID=A0A078KXS6_9GAMM|nr:ABC transporter permease [Legionella massiliensis]CDZ77822.1 putative phospholipid ABC transporter permease protein MlaE [Legionella massiliensis]CEE13560.1 putative phospholipid ABC transporter permease protein MlaE [Legionella massiliensis]